MPSDGLVAEVQDWAAGLEEVHRRIAEAFAWAEPRARVLAYLRGLFGQLERKNGWSARTAGRWPRLPARCLPTACSGCCAPLTGTPTRSVTSCGAMWLSAWP